MTDAPESPALTVTIEYGDSDALVVVSGEVDAATAGQVETALDEVIDRRVGVSIDLGNVGFIDSSGLRALIVARQRARGPRHRLPRDRHHERRRPTLRTHRIGRELSVVSERGPATPRDRIELRVPADPRFIRVVRLAASGLGASSGFDVERIEDLKIAVDEVCSTLLELGTDASVVLGLTPTSQGTIRVDGTVALVEDRTPDPGRFELTERILQVIAGDPRFERSATDASFSFEMAPNARPAASTN